MSSNILLTGGGTAGHVMPCLAILPEIRKHFDNVYYMGRKDSIEEKLCKENKITFIQTGFICTIKRRIKDT